MQASAKRLDFLPIIGRALRQLDVAALVDEIVPMDPRSRVSAGECVEALIVAILLGRHTLYRIDELLAPYDLELAFGWKGTCAQFHDDRLARALDDTFAAGPTKIQAAAVVRAVKVHDLELGTIHVDTSSVSVYGEYAASVPPLNPEDERAVPHVTRGHSKDYRSDLKQIVYGLAVACDGGVAVLGRVSSGNRSDPQETRWLMGRLAEVLPDPRGTTIVGDAKLFSGETLLLAQKHGFHVLTMMPRGVGLWGEAFTAFRAALGRDEPLTRLKVVYPKVFLEDGTAVDDLEAEPEKEWNGRSCALSYRWKDESTGVEHEFPIRALVVESTTLREQKTAIIEARRDKERKSLERIAARLGKREFKCEEDARRAAAAAIERHGPDLHRLVAGVVAERRPTKRPGPGRPPADEQREMETVWRAVLTIEHDQHDVDEAILRESCFVLITTRPSTGPDACSDQELFRTYQDQNLVETAIRIFKNPQQVAPLFLKTDARIAALGLVYVLALMVYALIQREVRRLLEQRGADFPGNKGWTTRPTTEVVFRLFEGINTIRVDGVPGVTVTNMTTAQRDALELLNHSMLTEPGVAYAQLAKPKPRHRGWRAKKAK